MKNFNKSNKSETPRMHKSSAGSVSGLGDDDKERYELKTEANFKILCDVLKTSSA